MSQFSRVVQSAHKFEPLEEESSTGERYGRFKNSVIVYRTRVTEELYILRFAPGDNKPPGDVRGDNAGRLVFRANPRRENGTMGGPPLWINPAKAFLKCPPGYLIYSDR